MSADGRANQERGKAETAGDLEGRKGGVIPRVAGSKMHEDA